jgi:hypothetical protein
MARKPKQAQTWPFPFFGAGDATYFEWAEVHVLFEREPSKAEKRKIKEGLPKALDDSYDWEGPALMVASDQFAHVAIAEQFGSKDDDDEDDDEDEDEYDESGWFFASSAAVTRFNKATDEWLTHAHSICPILLAFRREDMESGGTELSDWHAWSVRQLPRVLEHTRDIIDSPRDDHRTHLLVGAIEMAHEAKLKIDPEILDWARPERPLKRALDGGDGQELGKVLARYGERALSVLDDAIDEKQPAHSRALLAAAELLPPLDELECAIALVCAALAEPTAKHAAAVLERARAYLKKDPSWGNYLGYEGHKRITAKDWAMALALYELLLDVPDLDKTAYNNALYAVMHDNNGLPIDPARHRRFVEAALPHGPDNPSIYFNAACIFMELGETDRVFEHIELAIRHGFEGVEQMRGEALFKPLRKDPRFAVAFAAAPQPEAKAKKKAAKKKTAKKKASKKKSS